MKNIADACKHAIRMNFILTGTFIA